MAKSATKSTKAATKAALKAESKAESNGTAPKMTANIGVGAEATETIVNLLQKLLADQNLLYVKLRKYHWNVTGDNFFQLHEAFEGAYTELADLIDVTAEYVRQYGALAIGTLSEFQKYATLDEKAGHNPDGKTMAKEIAEDFEAICRYLREDIEAIDDFDDPAAEDMMTQMLRAHQKSAWLFRSFAE